MTIKKMYGFDHLVGLNTSTAMTHGFFSDVIKIIPIPSMAKIEELTVGGKRYTGINIGTGNNFRSPEDDLEKTEKIGFRITGEKISPSTIYFSIASSGKLLEREVTLHGYVSSGMETAYIEVEFAPPEPEFPSNKVLRLWINGVPVTPETKKYTRINQPIQCITIASMPTIKCVVGDIYYGVLDEASAGLYPLGSVVVKSSAIGNITELGNLAPVDPTVNPKDELGRFVLSGRFKPSYCMLNKKGTVSEISFPALTEKPLSTKLSVVVSKGVNAVEKIKVTPVDKTGDLTTVEHAPVSLTNGLLESIDFMFGEEATLDDTNAIKVKVGY